ncbi:MAG: hypothetical protein HZB65_03315 [Candidatus Aenigmarchaeota archaeon]|nr:hypothetical protein [Candidatus Aenigmarchaeota archaeon]
MAEQNIPEGFDSLLKLAMKEKPEPVKGAAIWDKFVAAALVGGGKSEADIQLLVKILGKANLLRLENVSKMNGPEWSDAVEKILRNELDRLRFGEDKTMINNFLKELFRITASIKGSARFFERKSVIKNIDEYTNDRKKTEEFIQEICDDEDVSNVKHTKAVLWLHSINRAEDQIPATRHVKSFVNIVYGYYSFYDDNKYFIEKANEILQAMQKKAKANGKHFTRAIFLYISVKSMVPRGFGKEFTVKKFLEFMKKEKLTTEALAKELAVLDKRWKLIAEVDKFVRK